MNAGLRRLFSVEYGVFTSDLKDRWAVDLVGAGVGEQDIKSTHRALIGLRCAVSIFGNRRGAGAFVSQVPETAYLACVLALKGLGNPSSVALRQMIELLLKFVYFSTHPIEYAWVCKSESLREFGFQTLVEYMKRLDLMSHKDAADSIETIIRLFSECSRYVHVHNSDFFTVSMRPATVPHIQDAFSGFLKIHRELAPAIITILMANSPNRYTSASVSEKAILNAAIGNDRKRRFVSYLRSITPTT